MARNAEAARLVKAEAARISAENAPRNAPFVSWQNCSRYLDVHGGWAKNILEILLLLVIRQTAADFSN